MLRDTYCSFCGQPFATGGYPKRCQNCKQWTYLNAPAVGIGIVPINDGLLMVRRASAPGIGELALPGGFKELHETWEQGIAREVKEETGIVIDTHSIKLVDVKTANGGAVLVFGICSRLLLPEPIQFNLDHETQEALIIDHAVPTCFPHHTAMVNWFWANRGDLFS